jgi:hypothetical protein
MCLGAVVGLLGAVVSGIGAAAQMKAQAANHQMQAQMQERQAEIERAAGDYEAARTQDTVKRTLGSQRAGFLANGLSLQGSADDVIDDTAREGALDIAAVQWNSKLKVDNQKYAAKVSRANADSAKSAVGIAFLSPVLGGVARFAGSFS